MSAAVDTHPLTSARPRPRLFPEELRTPSRPIHEAEPPWRRSTPAKPQHELEESAAQDFTAKDRAETQRLENEIGKADIERKEHCDSKKIDEALWALSQDLKQSPEEFSENARVLEQQRADIPRWTVALDRRDAELKEKMRPYAL